MYEGIVNYNFIHHHSLKIQRLYQDLWKEIHRKFGSQNANSKGKLKKNGMLYT